MHGWALLVPSRLLTQYVLHIPTLFIALQLIVYVIGSVLQLLWYAAANTDLEFNLLTCQILHQRK